MPFLSEADQDQLKEIFTNQMDRPVRLRVLTKPTSKLYIPGQQLCATCSEGEPFARELASLSDKLQVVVHDVQAEPSVAQAYAVDGTLPIILLEPVHDADAQTERLATSGAVPFWACRPATNSPR
jgi:hypothetical protein